MGESYQSGSDLDGHHDASLEVEGDSSVTEQAACHKCQDLPLQLLKFWEADFAGLHDGSVPTCSSDECHR